MAVLRTAGALPLAMAALAGGLALYAGRGGVGLSPDSLEYLGVARSLLRGDGLTVPFGAVGEEPFVGAPMTSFPPLYPLLLALGGGGLLWARLLAALSAAVTAGSVTAVVDRFTGRRLTTACLVALLLGPDFVRVHAQAWSEPVLLAVMAVGSLALVSHLDRPRRATRAGLLAACALAPMARYAGIVFVVAVAVVLARRHRWRDSGAAAAAGLVPLAAWLAYGAAVVADSGPGGRTVAWYGLPVADLLSQARETVGTYWLSGFGAGFGALALALLLVAVRPVRSEHLLYPVLVVLGSVALVVATRAAFDRTTVLDSRLLVPAHVGAVLALPFLVRPRRRWQGAAVGAAALLVVAGSVRWSTRFPTSGSRQYAASAWQRSPTLAAVDRLPPGAVIYSNGPEVVWWRTGRPVALLPLKHGVRSGLPQPWQERVRRIPAGAVVVLFHGIRRDFQPTEAELARVRPVRLREHLADGAIFEVATGQGPSR